MVLAGLLFSAGVNMFAQESAYAYDANGNLTKDLNKNIVDIQYNSLNLPSRIVFKNGDNISLILTTLTERNSAPFIKQVSKRPQRTIAEMRSMKTV